MDATDSAAVATRTMPHQHMIRAWRNAVAEPVSPRITDYASCAGAWWHRIGDTWSAVPDGPLASALSAGQARLARVYRDGGIAPVPRTRDPWTIARNRHRSGVCGKAPVFMPMRAIDLRPRQPVACLTRSAA